MVGWIAEGLCCGCCWLVDVVQMLSFWLSAQLTTTVQSFSHTLVLAAGQPHVWCLFIVASQGWPVAAGVGVVGLVVGVGVGRSRSLGGREGGWEGGNPDQQP